MKSTGLFAVLLSLTFNPAVGNSCGGLLESEQGHFSLANASNQEQPATASSSCLWIIQLHYENNIRFTLDALGDDAVLHLYPEDQLTSCSLSNYITLNSTQIGSSFELLGKTLIVVLPNSSASAAFSWRFIDNEDKNTSGVTMKNADYVNSPNGLLEWGQLETAEILTWGINTDASLNIKWDVDVATSCDAVDNCDCFYFGVFQLTSAGTLSEAVRTCGQSSEGKLEGISRRAVVLVKVNAKVEANKVAVSWGVDAVIVTEPPVTELPVTEPPVTVSPGIFAATNTGLIALNLQTLEAKSLTSEYTAVVAVNQNLEKIYWSEVAGNSRIMRSKFNGSDREIIVQPTGGYIFALAVHEPSGNIYFSVQSSNQITVCNALGENCAAVISSPSLANDPWSINFDYEADAMYWSNYYSAQSSLVRANLDGSSVTTISSGFSTSNRVAITLVQPYENLYWADNYQNTIGTVEANGSNKRTLVELEGDPAPEGIQVDANKIYLGNYNGRTIQSVDRDSGKELTTIFNSTGKIWHLALVSAAD